MRHRGGRDATGAVLFFLLATLVLTWPIARHMSDGLADLWDAKLNAWILHWDYHQIFHRPLDLFDANIFYPARYTLAFSENLFGVAILGFPLYAAGTSTLVVYNVLFLLGMFLSALGAWALARYVTGDAIASVVAGLVYAFVPWRLAQIPHLQFQWGGFLAFALLFLLKYLDGGRRRDQVLFGVFLAWNAAANVHYAIFSALLFALVLGFEALARSGVQARRRWWGALVAGALAVLVVLPLYVGYVRSAQLYGAERSDEEIRFFSGRPADFLTAGPQNKLYAPLTQQWAHPEGDLFPGLVALGLAVAAIIRVRRPSSPEKGSVQRTRRAPIARVLDVFVVVGLAAWTLARLFSLRRIGPIQLHDPGRVLVWITAAFLIRLVVALPARSGFADLRDLIVRMRLEPRACLFMLVVLLGLVVALGWHTPYYRFLVESLGPVFRSIRAPARGIVLFDLGLGVLASWGLAFWLRGRPLRTRLSLTAAAVLAIGIEYRAFPVETHPIDAATPPVYAWLASIPVPGGIVHLPLGNEYDFEHEFRSPAHWRPILNGSSGFAPSSYNDLAAALDKRPIPDAVWSMLRERNASVLLFHPGQLRGKATIAYAEALDRALTEDRIRLVRSFPHGDSRDSRDSRDYVFELASSGFHVDPERDLARSENDRKTLSTLRHPPFGFIDVPKDWDTMAPGSWGYGWALDDSGVARVTGALEDGTGVAVTMGIAHPGPPTVYPQYPGVERAGFNFQIPSLKAGTYKLIVTIEAQDRGTETLIRYFRVR